MESNRDLNHTEMGDAPPGQAAAMIAAPEAAGVPDAYPVSPSGPSRNEAMTSRIRTETVLTVEL